MITACRQSLERRGALLGCRSRYLQYVSDNRRDSASEPDEEEEDPTWGWVEEFDHKKKLKFWRNFSSNEITYDEPMDYLAHEKGMVGKRVQVFWVVQQRW